MTFRFAGFRFATKDAARQFVWDRLADAGQPREPLPPHGRIPDFAGARTAAVRLSDAEPWRSARTLKVNPDAPQRAVRLLALGRGVRVYVPTPRLAGGFLLLDPSRIPPQHHGEAATRATMQRLAEPVALEALPRFDAIVTGSAAVTPPGGRAMKACVRLLRLTLALLVLVAGPIAAEERLPTVVLLSWDGLRHDYPDLHSEGVPLPALARIAAEGVRARRLTPVFPSNTFPGHVSLATGTYPDRHGIPDNVFFDRAKGLYRYDPDANWLDAEPLWIAAERQGVPTATYFWVGSESDWHGRGTRYRIAPFDGDRPESEKVDQILAWLRLPAVERPRLIMSYWSGADDAGHHFGPDSDEVRNTLAAQDVQLGRLLAGLDVDRAWSHTTLVLVSDHGMTERGAFLDLEGALQAAGVSARVFGAVVAQVFLDDPDQLAVAEAAAVGLGHVRVYRGAELPAALRMRHPTRTGDLVVIAEQPYTLSRPAGLEGRLMTALQFFGRSFGMHGYDPELPDMGGVFMAMGRGVAADLELREVRQIDVAATVAALLGIEPPQQSEGRPIPGIGGS